MESTKSLEIIRTCAGNSRFCFKWISLCLFTVSLPFTLLLHNQKAEFPGLGEGARKAQHDIETLIPSPRPVPSVWRDYNPIQSGSTYIRVDFMNEGMYTSFIMFSPWMHQTNVLMQTVSSLVELICLQLWLVIRRLKKRQVVISLFLAIVISCLLLAAMDEPLTMIYSAVIDYFIEWIESKIVEVDLSTDDQDTILLHPFTQGKRAPFFLNKLLRYRGEDLVIMCEYRVFGNADVEPYRIKTWWRKNGVPIVETDRKYVTVSIESISEANLINAHTFQQYLIRSKLIIELLQPEDSGTYTCDYINPMPRKVLVKPYSERNNPAYVKAERSDSMSPNSKCYCQPTSNEKDTHPLPRKFPEPKCNNKNEHPLPRILPEPKLVTECFQEFELKIRPKETKTVNGPPGGILISAATYRTVVGVDDIKVDVTAEEDIDDKDDYRCCSLFIKIYWQLFRFSAFTDLPISLLLAQNDEHLTNKLTISKHSCICRHNSESEEYVFYRNYFNSTTKEHEEIKIKHPVSLFIEPEVGGSFPSFDTFSYCSSSNSNQWLCWCVEKWFTFPHNIFDIVFTILVILFIMWKFVARSANWISKPLRKFCLVSNSQRTLQFLAVNGQPHYIHSQDTMSSYNYDVYLSYSEDDEYDSQVAIHLKSLLENANLTVFDPVRDILPGRIVNYESAMSIQQSCLFVIIISKTFTEDNIKKMEYLAIQDTIVRRGSVPKDCILIVQVEDCEYIGLHYVPCIRVPDGLKENFSLDQSSVSKFCEWICTTVPMHKSRSTIGKIVTRLRAAGFTIMSAIYMLLLLYLASKSSLVAQWRAQLFVGLSYFRMPIEPEI